MKCKFCFILFFVSLLILFGGPLHAEEQQGCFISSLHHTGEGMRYWYEAKDGFMAISGVPYNSLGCKNCHVQSCDDCHLQKTEEGLVYSTEIARSSDTCLKCHAREEATLKYDEMHECQGVHAASNMGCMDCHSKKEVHGDGKIYSSMRQDGAMDTACTNCHTKDTQDYPVLPDTKSHTVHKGKLACNACHVQNSMTCYNCHFGVLAKTKSRPKSFAMKAKDFLLLVKYKGTVTSGTMQTLVGKNNEPFVSYVPYFTHSIMKEGRKCEQCHGTEAVKTLASSQTFTPAVFKDGKLEFYKGIIPVVPDLLNWPFLEKKGEQWVPFEPKTKPLVQMAVYAEPFTPDDLKKLKVKIKYEE
ncbi:MAG: hypothetical protein PHG14_08215 [Desulfobacter postgatei]|uniref:hypothetical protein n=1 Tax=Desulfobacter postgatei TaxID=2293 RepID=UPI0023F1125D|nr:hypothetical protein [Desulfobacter postgatei]MDD4273697.1 hypothetical protein [Desulfobacter postgatei]